MVFLSQTIQVIEDIEVELCDIKNLIDKIMKIRQKRINPFMPLKWYLILEKSNMGGMNGSENWKKKSSFSSLQL